MSRWHALAERERFYCATWRWAAKRHEVKKWGQAGFSTATERDSTSSGSKTKASNNPTISPIPDVLAQEIVEDLEAALEQFREIATEKDQ
jgi:hypothetical protein